MQDESRTFWLGGESVNAGTEVLTMKCHKRTLLKSGL